MKNSIGIDVEKSKILAEKLNHLLANYQLFYQNLRALHWNIKGKEFFELHLKFEELYDDAVVKVDEIAERILTLEHTPMHTFSDYVSHSDIQEAKNVVDGNTGIQLVLDNFKSLILIERDILSLSDEADDEGTNSMMSDYITQTEKIIWMLRSYLN